MFIVFCHLVVSSLFGKRTGEAVFIHRQFQSQGRAFTVRDPYPSLGTGAGFGRVRTGARTCQLAPACASTLWTDVEIPCRAYIRKGTQTRYWNRMVRPKFVQRFLWLFDPDDSSSSRRTARRYPLVFVSPSALRTVRLAKLLSLARIRVHHASTVSELRHLLVVTGAGVVLVDSEMENREDVLRGLEMEFPDVRTVALCRRDAESAARVRNAGAWKLVVEPARYFDLLCALESAHEVHQELTSPARTEHRVDAILTAAQEASPAGLAPAGPSLSRVPTAGASVLTLCLIRLPRPLH